MALFMTRKKREEIGDRIDDLKMKQYYKRCAIEDAEQKGDTKAAEHEKRRIEEIDAEISKLEKKLR